MRCNLEKLFVMVIPTFVDLQGFIVRGRFVVKEVAMLRKGTISTHYIFANPGAMEVDKIQKVLRFLVDCLSPWIAMGRRIPYSMAKHLIIMAVVVQKRMTTMTTMKFLYALKNFKNVIG